VGHGFAVAARLGTALRRVQLTASQGEVRAVPAATLVFAGEPILQLAGPAPETGRLAAAMAQTLAVQTAAATAAARMGVAAGGRPVIDTSSRSHPEAGARQRARGAIVGGATHTSNLWAAVRYGVPVVEATAPQETFPNVLAALITADDLDAAEVERLVRRGAPVTACAVGARIPEITVGLERWERASSPCALELYRYPASNGDIVQARDEAPVLFARPLLEHVVERGRRIGRRPSITAARTRCEEAVAVLPPEVRDLTRPDGVAVSWPDDVARTRDRSESHCGGGTR
jgi:hypothetical protein